MLTNSQKTLVHTAKRAFGITDDEYRQLWADVTGWTDCRSSTDKRIGQREFEKFMAYTERLFWVAVKKKIIDPILTRPFNPSNKTYWADRCAQGDTRRTAYRTAAASPQRLEIEDKLRALGYPAAKLDHIRKSCRYNEWAMIQAFRRLHDSLTQEPAIKAS